jgi:Penicillin-Binding Protein C-terminus Family
MFARSLLIVVVIFSAGMRTWAGSENISPRQLVQAGHQHSAPPVKSPSSPSEKKSQLEQTQEHSNPDRLKPAEGASVRIVSPKQGQSFKADQVPIQFKLTKGKRGHHVHAYVDNELVGMFESDKGTLNGIKPGKHTLELRVVADDHKTELDAKDAVGFTVK